LSFPELVERAVEEPERDDDVLVFYIAAVVDTPPALRSLGALAFSGTAAPGRAEVVVAAGFSRLAVSVQIMAPPSWGRRLAPR